jgi:hypothetical protein
MGRWNLAQGDASEPWVNSQKDSEPLDRGEGNAAKEAWMNSYTYFPHRLLWLRLESALRPSAAVYQSFVPDLESEITKTDFA